MKKRLGYSIAALGLFIALLSLTADFFGLGDHGIQAAQLLGIQAGVLTFFLGIGVLNISREKYSISSGAVRQFFERVLDLPISFWLLTGFLISYVVLFIFPAFFNADQRMFYFYRYIPDKYPIGSDLLHNTGAIKLWLQGNNPYSTQGHFYPPLYHLIFAPALLLGYPTIFYLITAITLMGFLVITFILPAILEKKNDLAVLLFFLLTGLFSYGLQFEIERGQFNVIAFALCYLAIYLFYYQSAFRYFAYLIFSISIHLKVYPAIFVVMFIEDWRNWKSNLKRLVGLGLANFALLFVLGPAIFVQFTQALWNNLGTGWTFPGNHSIKAFVYNLTDHGYGLMAGNTLSVLKPHTAQIELLFIALFILCFLSILFQSYKKNAPGLDPDLLLVCTLGALMIPSVSIDYTLELLAAPLALALSNRELPAKSWQKAIFIVAILANSVAYSFTLAPYKFRSGILENSFPMLLTILISITILNLISKRKLLVSAP